ncbi:hypothetical protein JCM3770_006396 [Rhodotorula araucariae]
MARVTSSDRGAVHAAPDRARPLWAALSLALQSAALAAILALAALAALVAWLVLRTALKVDPVVGRERVWLQYGQHRPPYALVPLQSGKYSAPGQVYDLALDLTVPVNPNNLDLGNFMVTLDLVDAAGEHVLNASRPAILSPPSAQPCLVPSKRSSTLSRLLSLPFSIFAPSRVITTASCLAPFASPSSGSRSSCTETLRIPLLERASLVAPVSSASAPKRSFWQRRRTPARRTPQGPATALYVQLGREDAYPQLAATELEGPATREVRDRPRELQVYEAWVTVEVQLGGVRAFLHNHPYLVFTTFVPSFLALELVAALAVYVLYVARAAPLSVVVPPEPARSVKRETLVGEPDDDIKPRLDRVPSSPPLPAFEEDAERAAAAEQQRRARRMRLGPGGVGMSEAFGAEDEGASELTETETGTDEEEAGESMSETGGPLAEEGEVGVVKEEDEGDEGTVAGSATTRRTQSTFGPSLAGTPSTRTTTTTTGLSAAAGLRARAPGARQGE